MSIEKLIAEQRNAAVKVVDSVKAELAEAEKALGQIKELKVKLKDASAEVDKIDRAIKAYSRIPQKRAARTPKIEKPS